MEKRQLSEELEGSRHLRIGFLASQEGTGMNAVLRAIQEGNLNATPEVVISNNPQSKAFKTAAMMEIPTFHISERTHPENTDFEIAKTLLDCGVELVICSDWMKGIDPITMHEFPNRIIASVPIVNDDYIGNMWMGTPIFRDISNRGKNVTGYTIFLVTENENTRKEGYDEKKEGKYIGPILETGFVRVSSLDDPYTLKAKVKFAGGEGLVSLLQDFSNPRKKTLYIMHDGELIETSFKKWIDLDKET